MEKNQQEDKLNVAEMRILHWMSAHAITRQDRIRNEALKKLG